MASWIESIKEFAKQNNGKFVIPKKGTEEYDKVRAIQQQGIETPKKVTVRKPKTANPPTEKKVIAVAPPEVPKIVTPVGEKVANPPTEKKVTVGEAVKPRVKKDVKEEKAKEAKAKRIPKSKAVTTIVKENVVMAFE